MHNHKRIITIVFDFPWDDCNTQEKLETMVMQNIGGLNKVRYNLFENGELPGSEAASNVPWNR